MPAPRRSAFGSSPSFVPIAPDPRTPSKPSNRLGGVTPHSEPGECVLAPGFGRRGGGHARRMDDAEARLVGDLSTLKDRLADERFCGELYRALAGGHLT